MPPQVTWVVPEARFGRIDRSIGEPPCVLRVSSNRRARSRWVRRGFEGKPLTEQRRESDGIPGVHGAKSDHGAG
jgi:hypothetical protein